MGGDEHNGLTAEIGRAISFQSYEPRPSIDGVRITPLVKHRAENGWFVELLRLSDGRVDAVTQEGDVMQPRQVSAAYAAPGRINAFHLHPKRGQSELWCVLRGALMVWLIDTRAGSRTEGVKQRVILTDEEPALLLIPADVAHGYRACQDGALLFYVADQQFDPANPDEARLPWDYFGAQLWEDDRG